MTALTITDEHRKIVSKIFKNQCSLCHVYKSLCSDCLARAIAEAEQRGEQRAVYEHALASWKQGFGSGQATALSDSMQLVRTQLESLENAIEALRSKP